jgi:FdhD protein
MDTFLKHDVIFIDGTETTAMQFKIINERPLSIWVNEKFYQAIMRTPGNEFAHAAGFCLYKGLVTVPDDLISLSFKDDKNRNEVSVLLNKPVPDESSYPFVEGGIMTDNEAVDVESAIECLEKLSNKQPLRFDTHAAHAAALYNSNLELLSVAEDVGRHNAVDKAVGKLFLDNTLGRAHVFVLSSRISYELVQKAARAKVSVILAISRPTSLAIELAERMNITLACLAKGSGLYVFCGDQRFKTKKGFINK